MIDAYLNTTVTVVRTGALDQWNEPTAPVEETVRARVDWRTRLTRNTAGELVTAAAAVMLRELVQHEDRIKIDGISHAIIAIHRVEAWSLSHYEVVVS